MSTTLDPAISAALGIKDPSSAKVSSHGGSGFSKTLKVAATIAGEKKMFFVKTGGKESDVMFEGEHTSLNAIHAIVPTFCPRSYAHGTLSSSAGSFLATDFLNLSSRHTSSTSSSSSASPDSGLSFAAKLAKLHSQPAPVPEGYSKPMFGFPVKTCCGNTVQENGFMESWAEFYAERRLRAVMRASEKNNGPDAELKALVERTAVEVVPRLLGAGHLGGEEGIQPVVVHGDLWSGNHGRGSIGNGPVEEVVYDPSAVYGHSEYELGIMNMFGGFGGGVLKEYHRLVPKTEPLEEYDDRIALYELYHHMNHHAMFGGGYRSGAMSIMKKLVAKYASSGGG